MPAYVRYADDLVLFGCSKRELWGVHSQLQRALAEIRLRLHRSKTQLRPATHGLSFLGLRLAREDRRLTQDAIKRFVRRRRRLQYAFARGETSPQYIRRSLAAWVAHAGHANSSGIRKDLLRNMTFTRPRSAR